jgi:quercetin dioxygenase-like cupin family protein
MLAKRCGIGEPVRLRTQGAEIAGTHIFTLAPGEAIPWHYHSETTDHYFVLRGTLTIETRIPDDQRLLEVGGRYQIMPISCTKILEKSSRID